MPPRVKQPVTLDYCNPVEERRRAAEDRAMEHERSEDRKLANEQLGWPTLGSFLWPFDREDYVRWVFVLVVVVLIVIFRALIHVAGR